MFVCRGARRGCHGGWQVDAIVVAPSAWSQQRAGTNEDSHILVMRRAGDCTRWGQVESLHRAECVRSLQWHPDGPHRPSLSHLQSMSVLGEDPTHPTSYTVCSRASRLKADELGLPGTALRDIGDRCD